MRKNIFFTVICFLTICENFVSSNVENNIGNLFKSSDVSKEPLEVSVAANADESKNGNDACQTDKDCSNFGTCKDNEGQKLCLCRKGTSGRKCEIIDECVKTPLLCGDGSDVECAYDYNSRKAFCKCLEKSKRFDIPTKTCVDQKPCDEQKKCLNGGVCTNRGDAKYCKCILGTSGNFCERIEECFDKPNLCGAGEGVKCEFNVRQERAYCQCKNQNLRFDLPQKKCVERTMCRGNEECGRHGLCTNRCQDYEPCYDYDYDHIEDKSSCHCVEGTSGEKCEIVDDCFNKVVDCGSGDNVKCTYSYTRGMKGQVLCKCKNGNQRFDNVVKLCKDCDCGAMGDTCNFVKGQKKCTCKPLSYNFGDRCEDCKCGEESKGCSFEGGSKTCFCNAGFLELSGRCERCDCGKNSTDCRFENGTKVCTCEPGFTEGNYGICTPMCNDTRRCANGGICLKNVCMCLAGTGGPFCETVTDCKNKMCGIHQNVSCEYDTEKQKAFCQCKNTDSVFDTFNKTCKMCECYRWSSEEVAGSCEFVRGNKVCHCKEGYTHSPVIDKCYPCNCGPNSTSCSIDQEGKIFCDCKDGFADVSGICAACDCGPYSTSCNFKELVGKVCGCEDGFVDVSGVCEECDCGKNGICRYIKEAKKDVKICFCKTGYKDYNGTCLKCDCGANGKCYINKDNTQNCICDTGYAEDTGKCKICDCGPDSQCFYKSKQKRCKCPPGFKSKGRYCRDRDECEDPKSCPEPGTVCLNTIGSFKCDCKPGFIPRPLDAKETTPLCTKQEETPPNYTPWKIGYGILTAGFMVIIIGLVIVIFKLRRQNSIDKSPATELSVTYSRR